MPLTRVRELLIGDLSELLETEEEILRQLPLMAARASAAPLRALFEDHYRDTQRQVTRLHAIFALLDERHRPTTAPAIRGLVEESRLRQSILEHADLLDLALIDFARRMEHYEIAAYSATIAYARRLGFPEVARLLADTLEEERRADAQLERLSAPTRVHAA